MIKIEISNEMIKMIGEIQLQSKVRLKSTTRQILKDGVSFYEDGSVLLERVIKKNPHLLKNTFEDSIAKESIINGLAMDMWEPLDTFRKSLIFVKELSILLCNYLPNNSFVIYLYPTENCTDEPAEDGWHVTFHSVKGNRSDWIDHDHIDKVEYPLLVIKIG